MESIASLVLILAVTAVPLLIWVWIACHKSDPESETDPVAVVKIEPFRGGGDGDTMITVMTAHGERKYVGWQFVWYQYPSGKRAGYKMEDRLSEALRAWQWRQKEKN